MWMSGREQAVSMFFGPAAKSFFPSQAQWSQLIDNEFEVGETDT